MADFKPEGFTELPTNHEQARAFMRVAPDEELQPAVPFGLTRLSELNAGRIDWTSHFEFDPFLEEIAVLSDVCVQYAVRYPDGGRTVEFLSKAVRRALVEDAPVRETMGPLLDLVEHWDREGGNPSRGVDGLVRVAGLILAALRTAEDSVDAMEHQRQRDGAN